MYTGVVSKKHIPPSPALGTFMRRWRDAENLTQEEAGRRIGLTKGAWSKLERGLTSISIETLMALSQETGISSDELAVMANYPVRHSASVEDRSRRVAELAEAMPAIGAMIDLLAELSADDVDTLVSLGESLVQKRRSHK